MTVVDDYYLVFCSGQSNAIGQGYFGPSTTGVEQNLVRVWNNGNEAVAYTNGTAFIASPAQSNAPYDQLGGSNNASAWFCDRLARETQKNVRLIMIAEDNKAIDQWDQPNGEMYVNILAEWQISQSRQADIWIWHQGESDNIAGTSEATYKAKFLTLRESLIEQNVIHEDTVIIIGGMGPTHTAYDAVLENLCDENGFYFADCTNVPMEDAGTHFSGNGLHYIGTNRFWSAYCQHTGPNFVRGSVSAFF